MGDVTQSIMSSVKKTEAHAGMLEQIIQRSNQKHINYDDDTTIKANGNARTAFENSVDSMFYFENQMKRQASNIRSIGLAFQEVDKMCANQYRKEN